MNFLKKETRCVAAAFCGGLRLGSRVVCFPPTFWRAQTIFETLPRAEGLIFRC
jgi:hypothetical protein